MRCSDSRRTMGNLLPLLYVCFVLFCERGPASYVHTARDILRLVFFIRTAC